MKKRKQRRIAAIQKSNATNEKPSLISTTSCGDTLNSSGANSSTAALCIADQIESSQTKMSQISTDQETLQRYSSEREALSISSEPKACQRLSNAGQTKICRATSHPNMLQANSSQTEAGSITSQPKVSQINSSQTTKLCQTTSQPNIPQYKPSPTESRSTSQSKLMQSNGSETECCPESSQLNMLGGTSSQTVDNSSVCTPKDSMEKVIITPYQTPRDMKKKYRQRACVVRKSMPQEARYAVAVLNHIFKGMLRNPDTKEDTKKVLVRYHTAYISQNQTSTILKTVLAMTKAKAKKDIPKLQFLTQQLKNHCPSLRQVANHLRLPVTTLQRLTVAPKLSKSRLSSKDVSEVKTIFSSDRFSIGFPMARYAGKRFLRATLAESYAEYAKMQKQNGNRIVSKSTVSRILKKANFKSQKSIPYIECQCGTCVNHGLLIDALQVHRVKHISRRMTLNLNRSMCSVVGEGPNQVDFNDMLGMERRYDNVTCLTDHRRNCIYRTCKTCGAVQWQQAIVAAKANENLNWNEVVVWHQWETQEVEVEKKNKKSKKGGTTKQNDKETTKKHDKYQYTGTLAELLTKFTHSLEKMSVHMFDFRWQALQFESLKEQLKPGDVLLVMDFSQNLAHKRQHASQGSYYGRRQTTLHPIVAIYPCRKEKCSKEGHVTNEIVIWSTDLKHDGAAVNKHLEKALSVLKKHKVPLKRLFIFTDNCAPQYKSCRVFKNLSKLNIPVWHSYFGASHGKSCADASSGRIKQKIERYVRTGAFDISDIDKLMIFCRVVLARGPKDGDTECYHWRRCFYQIEDIDRSEDKDLLTIPGTQMLHSVRNTGVPGIVEVSEASCFCSFCFSNEGEQCENENLVRPFRWAAVSKAQSRQITGDLENKLWGGKSSKFKTESKPCLMKRTYTRKNVKNKATASKKCTKPSEKKRKEQKNSKKAIESECDATIILENLHNSLEEGKEEKVANSKKRNRTIKKQKKCHKDSGSESSCELSSSEDSFVSEFEEELLDSDALDDIPLAKLKNLEAVGSNMNCSPIGYRTRKKLENTVKNEKLEKPIGECFADDEGTDDEAGMPAENRETKDLLLELLTLDETVSSGLEIPKFSTPKRKSKLSVNLASKFFDEELEGIEPIPYTYDSDFEEYNNQTENKFAEESEAEIDDLLAEVSEDEVDEEFLALIEKTLDKNELEVMMEQTPVKNNEIDKKKMTERENSDFNWANFNARLQSCKTFRALCKEIQGINSMPLVLSDDYRDFYTDTDRIDEVAVSNLPNDLPKEFKDFLPVCTEADGNCFFRTLSRLVYGSECRHIEMRCRIVVDLVTNFEKYASHEYLMRGACHNYSKSSNFHIGSLYSIYSGVQDDNGSVTSALEQHIMKIRKNKQYASVWEFHAAANVLNAQIYGVFPTKYRLNSRVDHNRVFLPKNSTVIRKLAIAWTSLVPGHRDYSHIVPLVQKV